MWNKPAGAKVLGVLAVLAALSVGARADELGTDAVFPPPMIVSSLSGGPTGVLWESGISATIAEPWDTVLFQGICSDTAAVFQVSRELGDGQWTAWQDAPVERFPRGRFWGKFVFPSSGPGAVRLQAVDNGALAVVAQKIEILSVEVFAAEPVSDQKSAPPLLLAVGGGTRPFVYSRESWGAKPPKRPYDPLLPYRITLHHTHGPQPTTLAEAEAELRFIQDFHQRGRGWSDIAYQFLIDASGRIYEGRPETAEGSHTLHNNEGNIGIALMGNHHPPKNDPVTAAERDALARLGQYLVQHYGIDPRSLRGHRDYKKRTECPGDLAYALIPALRDQFAQTQSLAQSRGPKHPPKTAQAPAWDGR